jgi:toxin YoeB
LAETPQTGVGQPKKLKNDLSGLWSRRINKKDRLVYEIVEYQVIVIVLSVVGHYSD